MTFPWFFNIVFLILSVRVDANWEPFDNLESALPPIQSGLSWTFYNESCPEIYKIVHDRLKVYLDADITQAAGLLRLHFHDCFVLGCDASVLLDGSASGPGEQSAIPNLTLRPEAFQIINNIKESLEAVCPTTVSCADIVALTARYSITMAGGPRYPVPLGRRDNPEFATQSVTLSNLPPPSDNVTALLSIFNDKGLNTTDLVALSGAHTIGRAHCASFSSRLEEPDPNLNTDLVDELLEICPTTNSTNFTNMDVNTPNRFDNKYYQGLVNKTGLFVSDSSLIQDARTNESVLSYYANESLFFWHFSLSMIKMGQLGILTGTEGEIRTNCSAPNNATTVQSIIISEADLEDTVASQ